MSAWRRSAWGWLAAASIANAVSPEKELEFAARDAERSFERAGVLDPTNRANDYLRATLTRLVDVAPNAALAHCRIQVMKGGKPNAFALPNCSVYVSTALVMALENDAQLAAVIVRELAHIQNQSALKQRVTLVQADNWAHALSLAFAAGLGATPGSSSNKEYPALTKATGDLIWRVSVRGYSHELENAADASALVRYKAAGYAPANAMRALTRLRDEAPAKPGSPVPLLSSLPHLEARIASLKGAGISSDGADAASEPYVALVDSLRLDQVRVLIDAREYTDASRLLAGQVAMHGDSGTSHFYAGELARRNGSGSRTAALIAYEQGAAFADAPARLFLSQGLMLREDHEHGRARVAFRRFLELEPDAIEAPLIRAYLKEQQPNSGE